MNEQTVPQLFEAAGRQLHAEFVHIMETNPHSGEKGSELEDVLRRFLNQHIPQRYRATSGILIDTENRRSRQTDVIVYDALSSPVYRASERLQILPAHTAAAVIEVFNGDSNNLMIGKRSSNDTFCIVVFLLCREWSSVLPIFW